MYQSFFSKLRINTIACALVVLSLGSAAQGVAQTQVLQFTVPFAFQSGSEKMPAGTYRIDLPSEHVLQLRGQTTQASAFAIANPELQVQAPVTGKVIFRKYGNQYFLSELWQAGNPTGRKLVKGRDEKEAQIAMNVPKSDTVTIALNVSHR